MDMKGNLASNWEFFKDSWKNYAVATKLDKKEPEIVAATLLSVMGKECLQVCRNLPMTEDERKNAESVLTKLSEYFEPKRNTIYERYVFNSRFQQASEGFDQFMNEMRKLTATCKYGVLEDEMLRDQIVIGIRANNTRERLLRESDLTLERAINICRTNEMAAKQRQKMEQPEVVNYASSKEPRQRTSAMPHSRSCKYCGYSPQRKMPGLWQNMCEMPEEKSLHKSVPVNNQAK